MCRIKLLEFVSLSFAQIGILIFALVVLPDRLLL
jgi:hypothetical protein